MFPSQEFATIPNVPVFKEHETTARDGRTLTFGFEELQAVCNRCNRRIQETGDYAAIVIGHTPEPEAIAQGAHQPELVGYAGPFRMGTIGEGDRKLWAILCDFHVFRDRLAEVRRHPRRSPELWLEDSYDEMFLDPIALLGAEAPRLDLGLLTGAQGGDGAAEAGQSRFMYAASLQGRTVEKYAMAAVASAGNVFTPSTSTIKRPRQYEADNQATTTPSREKTMLDPADVKAIMEAFMQSDVGQWIQQKMAEESGPNTTVPNEQEPPTDGNTATPLAGQETPEEEALEAKAAGVAPPEAQPVQEPPADVATAAPAPAAADDEQKKNYAAACEAMDKHSDEDVEKYLHKRWSVSTHPRRRKYAAELAEGSANGNEGDGKKPPEGSAGGAAGNDASTVTAPATSEIKPEEKVETEHYSREHYARELGHLRQEIAVERSKRVSAERYQRLGALSMQYAMELPEEMARCAPDKMTDEAFADHCNKVIREHYQRIPLGVMPIPDDPAAYQAEPSTSAGKTEKYRRDTVLKAQSYCERRKAAGGDVDFGEVLDAIESGRALPD